MSGEEKSGGLCPQEFLYWFDLKFPVPTERKSRELSNKISISEMECLKRTPVLRHTVADQALNITGGRNEKMIENFRGRV